MLLVLRIVEERCHRDDEGRPLRESRTPAACLTAADLEFRACPYPGTRSQLPMNVAALHQMSAHWGDVLDTIAQLRVRYQRVRGRADQPLEVLDLWRIAQLASALPWWFILADGGTSPAYAAALAKAAQGVGIWAQRVFVTSVATRTPPPPLTPATIVELAEANGTLHAQAEVCGASDKMLRRFFDAMVDDPPASIASPAVERWARAEDRVLAFAAYYLDVKLVLWIHFLARRFVYADLVAALAGERARIGDTLDALDALIAGEPEPGDFFVIGPDDLAGTPAAARVAWLGALALGVVPCAPGAEDAPVVALAHAIALTAPTDDVDVALAAEVAAVTGCGADAAARCARALGVYARLDGLLAELVRLVEAGLRRAVGVGAAPGPIDAADRDRMLVASPRATLLELAPTQLARRCPP